LKIWVDADAFPVAMRKILYKAAQRTGTEVTLIANQAVPIPRTPLITMRIVPQGFDAADDEIVRLVNAGRCAAAASRQAGRRPLDKPRSRLLLINWIDGWHAGQIASTEVSSSGQSSLRRFQRRVRQCVTLVYQH